jgi:hypothetical protein
VGEEISLPLFVVNDLPRALGRVAWIWELYVEGEMVAQGAGELQVPADSVVGIGRAGAKRTVPGRATLLLKLSGEGATDEANSYEFLVRSDR